MFQHDNKFFSVASEDKGEFVRPLAKALGDSGKKVWFDEFTLKVGDSLRQSLTMVFHAQDTALFDK